MRKHGLRFELEFTSQLCHHLAFLKKMLLRKARGIFLLLTMKALQLALGFPSTIRLLSQNVLDHLQAKFPLTILQMPTEAEPTTPVHSGDYIIEEVNTRFPSPLPQLQSIYNSMANYIIGAGLYIRAGQRSFPCVEDDMNLTSAKRPTAYKCFCAYSEHLY